MFKSPFANNGTTTDFLSAIWEVSYDNPICPAVNWKRSKRNNSCWNVCKHPTVRPQSLHALLLVQPPAVSILILSVWGHFWGQNLGQSCFFSYFLVASFQPFSFFLVCRRGWSPAGTCSPACQSCDREIDHFSYSAFIYRPRLQSIRPVGGESDFRFKVARTGNRTRDTSRWPRFFLSALSTRPTLLPRSKLFLYS